MIVCFCFKLGPKQKTFQKIAEYLQHAHSFCPQIAKDKTKFQLYSSSLLHLLDSFGLEIHFSIFCWKKKGIFFSKASFWALVGLKEISNGCLMGWPISELAFRDKLPEKSISEASNALHWASHKIILVLNKRSVWQINSSGNTSNSNFDLILSYKMNTEWLSQTY